MGLLRSRNNGVEPHLEEKAKNRISTDFIEDSSQTAGVAEHGGHKLVGSSDEDVPLTQEDIDFVREMDESGRGKKIVRKTDWHLIPILVVVRTFSADVGGCAERRLRNLQIYLVSLCVGPRHFLTD